MDYRLRGGCRHKIIDADMSLKVNAGEPDQVIEAEAQADADVQTVVENDPAVAVETPQVDSQRD